MGDSSCFGVVYSRTLRFSPLASFFAGSFFQSASELYGAEAACQPTVLATTWWCTVP